ncbi:MAG: hypothetical protein MHMPM18_001768 [Marteilia pararefringens]
MSLKDSIAKRLIIDCISNSGNIGVSLVDINNMFDYKCLKFDIKNVVECLKNLHQKEKVKIYKEDAKRLPILNFDSRNTDFSKPLTENSMPAESNNSVYFPLASMQDDRIIFCRKVVSKFPAKILLTYKGKISNETDDLSMNYSFVASQDVQQNFLIKDSSCKLEKYEKIWLDIVACQRYNGGICGPSNFYNLICSFNIDFNNCKRRLIKLNLVYESNIKVNLENRLSSNKFIIHWKFAPENIKSLSDTIKSLKRQEFFIGINKNALQESMKLFVESTSIEANRIVGLSQSGTYKNLARFLSSSGWFKDSYFLGATTEDTQNSQLNDNKLTNSQQCAYQLEKDVDELFDRLGNMTFKKIFSRLIEMSNSYLIDANTLQTFLNNNVKKGRYISVLNSKKTKVYGKGSIESDNSDFRIEPMYSFMRNFDDLDDFDVMKQIRLTEEEMIKAANLRQTLIVSTESKRNISKIAFLHLAIFLMLKPWKIDQKPIVIDCKESVEKFYVQKNSMVDENDCGTSFSSSFATIKYAKYLPENWITLIDIAMNLLVYFINDFLLSIELNNSELESIIVENSRKAFYCLPNYVRYFYLQHTNYLKNLKSYLESLSCSGAVAIGPSIKYLSTLQPTYYLSPNMNVNYRDKDQRIEQQYFEINSQKMILLTWLFIYVSFISKNIQMKPTTRHNLKYFQKKALSISPSPVIYDNHQEVPEKDSDYDQFYVFMPLSSLDNMFLREFPDFIQEFNSNIPSYFYKINLKATFVELSLKIQNVRRNVLAKLKLKKPQRAYHLKYLSLSHKKVLKNLKKQKNHKYHQHKHVRKFLSLLKHSETQQSGINKYTNRIAHLSSLANRCTYYMKEYLDIYRKFPLPSSELPDINYFLRNKELLLASVPNNKSMKLDMCQLELKKDETISIEHDIIKIDFYSTLILQLLLYVEKNCITIQHFGFEECFLLVNYSMALNYLLKNRMIYYVENDADQSDMQLMITDKESLSAILNNCNISDRMNLSHKRNSPSISSQLAEDSKICFSLDSKDMKLNIKNLLYDLQFETTETEFAIQPGITQENYCESLFYVSAKKNIDQYSSQIAEVELNFYSEFCDNFNFERLMTEDLIESPMYTEGSNILNDILSSGKKGIELETIKSPD